MHTSKVTFRTWPIVSCSQLLKSSFGATLCLKTGAGDGVSAGDETKVCLGGAGFGLGLGWGWALLELAIEVEELDAVVCNFASRFRRIWYDGWLTWLPIYM